MRLGDLRQGAAPTLPRPDHAREQRLPGESGRRVALRQLVVAASSSDVQLPGWLDILDRLGSPYDVVCADRDPLGHGRLVTGGVGRYNAILLTSAGLLRPDHEGFVSAWDAAAWSALWSYQRTYRVRQVALNAAPGAHPEDHGLRPVSEGPTGHQALHLRTTADGAAVFDYLRPDARLPLADAYVYRAGLAPGANTRPLLLLDDDVVAAVATAPDGRQSALVCFTLGAAQPIQELLGYGLVRWATRGVLLGEHRHWLNVDIDDWCDLDTVGAQDWPSDVPAAGASTRAVAVAQERVRREFPLAAELRLNLAYNGGGPAVWKLPVPAGTARRGDLCAPTADVRWVNHTFSHPCLQSASYEQSHAEISANLEAARRRGLAVDASVLKTPGYSGLGVVAGTDGERRVVEQGLAASNRQLLAAARHLGVRYVHGNMSFRSHRPTCFNGGIPHPLQPEIVVVPDWPTGIAWWAATPDEALAGYPVPALPGGGRAAPPSGYPQLLEIEAEEACRHLMRGSVYTHTLHRANTHEFGPGRSLLVDWLVAVLEKYSALYRVPLRTPDWTSLAHYVVARTAHAAAAAGTDATWDREDDTVHLAAAADTSLFVTGAVAGPLTAGSRRMETEVYGTDPVSRVDLARGEELLLSARPLP